MKKETIRQKLTFNANPTEIYEAFTDSKKHSAFTGSIATGEGKVCATFTAWDGYISGKFLELEEGKKIVQEWKTTDWPEGYPPSKFEIKLKAIKGGTEVSMIHSGVPVEQVKEIREGWDEYYWRPLKSYLEKLHLKRKKPIHNHRKR